jgi:hypothetical protein
MKDTTTVIITAFTCISIAYICKRARSSTKC